MAEKSRFFNSIEGDRRYGAADWAAYFAAMVSNGILQAVGDGLVVTAGAGLSVQVGQGAAQINGYQYTVSQEAISLALSPAVQFRRVDRIVIRYSAPERRIYAAVVAGTEAETPAAPDIIRTGTIYDLCLAEVTVLPGVLQTANARIRDTRFDAALCGVASLIIQAPGIEDIYRQYEAILSQKISEGQESFDAWFQSLQIILEGDVAANLAGQILRKVDQDAIVNNLTTDDAGYVLDARQGKALDGRIADKQDKIASANAASVRAALGLKSGAMREVQRSTATIAAEANSTVTVSISFPVAFSGTPSVAASLNTSAPQNRSLTVADVSAAGMTIVLYNGTSYTGNLVATWIAVY